MLVEIDCSICQSTERDARFSAPSCGHIYRKFSWHVQSARIDIRLIRQMTLA